MSEALYDRIGRSYCTSRRRPEDRLANREGAGGFQSVLNVGAGSGSYEPEGRDVTAVKPSREVIAQRASGAVVMQTSAERLPFPDDSFDAAMALLSDHHWAERDAGVGEMLRVAGRGGTVDDDRHVLTLLSFIR